jgi:hypothetical protein
MGNSRLLAVLLYTPDGSKTTAASFEHSYQQPSAPYSHPPAAAPPTETPVAGGTSVTPAAVDPTTPADDMAPTAIDESEPAEDILSDLSDGNIPLGNINESDVWSLLSLILAILALVSAALAIPSAILTRRRANEANGETDGWNARKPNVSIALEGSLILLGVLTLALWMIFDDTSKPMAWINDRTLVVAIPFIVQTVLRIPHAVIRLRERRNSAPSNSRAA